MATQVDSPPPSDSTRPGASAPAPPPPPYLVRRHRRGSLLLAGCPPEQLRPLVPVVAVDVDGGVVGAALEALHGGEAGAPAPLRGAGVVGARLRHPLVRGHLLEGGEALGGARQTLLVRPGREDENNGIGQL